MEETAAGQTLNVPGHVPVLLADHTTLLEGLVGIVFGLIDAIVEDLSVEELRLGDVPAGDAFRRGGVAVLLVGGG